MINVATSKKASEMDKEIDQTEQNPIHEASTLRNGLEFEGRKIMFEKGETLSGTTEDSPR